MLDIDHFKKVNDTYGHSIGDEVLIQLSRILSKSIRKVDILFRWGGEEFLILMPNIEGEEAYKAAERLRKTIQDARFVKDIPIRASFGVTQLQDADTLDALVKRADKAQYKAKASGRNNVQLL